MGHIYIRTSTDLDPIQVLYFIYLFIDGQVLYLLRRYLFCHPIYIGIGSKSTDATLSFFSFPTCV